MSIASKWHAAVGGLLRSISHFSNGRGLTTTPCSHLNTVAVRYAGGHLQNDGSTLTMTITDWWCVDCSACVATGHSPPGSQLIGYEPLLTIWKENRGQSKTR